MKDGEMRTGISRTGVVAILAVVFVLLSLIFGGIVVSLEASGRMQCMNNQKALALAMHMSHDYTRKLPPLDLGKDRLLLFGTLYPYMEQASLFITLNEISGKSLENLNTTDPDAFWFSSKMESYDRRSFSSVPWFQCPTRRLSTSERLSALKGGARSMIAGQLQNSNAGEGFQNASVLAAGPYSDYAPVVHEANGKNFGPFVANGTVDGGGTVPTIRSSESMARWTDGSSNQLIWGEKFIPDGGVGTNQYSYPWDGSYLGACNASDRGRDPGLGLKAPSSAIENAQQHFGGPHKGVCFFALGDGSVRYVNNDVSTEILASLAHVSDGKYGVDDLLAKDKSVDALPKGTDELETASESAPASESETATAIEIVETSTEPSPAVDARARDAGTRKVLTINGVEVAFRWAPAGRFTMGSPEDEVGRFDDETQHEVILTQGFWLAETETTQALWKAVMGRNPSEFTGDDLHPVERVSWDDCQAFIHKLNAGAKGAGVGVFRLPSEAEWEYACRAGTTTAFPWGNVLNGDKANCDGNYPYGTEEKGNYLEKTTRVGSYESNAWGLYDMIGNVWEWCQDRYDAYPSGTETDPQGATSGSNRVLRGGSWNYDPGYCRSAYRYYNDPANSLGNCGFRLAMTGESALFESFSK